MEKDDFFHKISKNNTINNNYIDKIIIILLGLVQINSAIFIEFSEVKLKI